MCGERASLIAMQSEDSGKEQAGHTQSPRLGRLQYLESRSSASRGRPCAPPEDPEPVLSAAHVPNGDVLPLRPLKTTPSSRRTLVNNGLHLVLSQPRNRARQKRCSWLIWVLCVDLVTM